MTEQLEGPSVWGMEVARGDGYEGRLQAALAKMRLDLGSFDESLVSYAPGKSGLDQVTFVFVNCVNDRPVSRVEYERAVAHRRSSLEDAVDEVTVASPAGFAPSFEYVELTATEVRDALVSAAKSKVAHGSRMTGESLAALTYGPGEARALVRLSAGPGDVSADVRLAMFDVGRAEP